MQFWFIFSLVFSIFVAMFAVMNSDVVTIQLLWKRFKLSQSVVILISAVFGALVTYSISIIGKIKSGIRSRESKARIESLERTKAELEELNKKSVSEIERLKAELIQKETATHDSSVTLNKG